MSWSACLVPVQSSFARCLPRGTVILQAALPRRSIHTLATGSVRKSLVQESAFSSGLPSVGYPEESDTRHSEVADLCEQGDAEPSAPHVPVLEQEVVACFKGRRVQVFVDGTLGAAGHSCAILADHPEIRQFVGFDVDPLALHLSKHRLHETFADRLVFPSPVPALPKNKFEADCGLTGKAGTAAQDSISAGSLGEGRTEAHLLQGNFQAMRETLRTTGLEPGSVDGILLDVGVSSMQIDNAERGFSFLQDGPLDMRMNPLSGLTAEDIVNHWGEAEIGRVLREYGEERHWKALARRIVDARKRGRIQSTAHLADILSGGTGKASFAKGKKPYSRNSRSSRNSIHPATRSFQALRIAVNGELDVLKRVLPHAASLLAPRGRLAVISFHSLEDRIVKHGFLEAARTPSDSGIIWEPGVWDLGGTFSVVTNKPVVATPQETAANSRSRSAKLRILERKQ